MNAGLMNELLVKTGVLHLTYGHVIMWLIGLLFIYLAIKKDFEPFSLSPSGSASFSSTCPLHP